MADRRQRKRKWPRIMWFEQPRRLLGNAGPLVLGVDLADENDAALAVAQELLPKTPA